MCRTGNGGVELNIFEQLVQGNYDEDDYVLINQKGEIQGVSGNDEFWDGEVMDCPPSDQPYVILKLKSFVEPSHVGSYD